MVQNRGVKGIYGNLLIQLFEKRPDLECLLHERQRNVFKCAIHNCKSRIKIVEEVKLDSSNFKPEEDEEYDLDLNSDFIRKKLEIMIPKLIIYVNDQKHDNHPTNFEEIVAKRLKSKFRFN